MNFNSEALHLPDAKIRQELSKALHELIERGPQNAAAAVVSFERDFAELFQFQYCRSTASAAEAAYLALCALQIGPDDEVITTPFAHEQSLSAICRTGAKIRFVDINPLTLSIDAGQLERAISSRSKILMPAHIFGQPAELDFLSKFARQHELYLLEDASEACGAAYRGKPVGAFGVAGFFGFSQNCPFGAYGASGALVANSEMLAERINQRVDSGGKTSDAFRCAVAQANPMQVQVLSVLLPHLAALNEAQRQVATTYQAAFEKNESIGIRAEPEGMYSIYQQYFIEVADREQVLEQLLAKGIPAALCSRGLAHRDASLKPFLAEVRALPAAEYAAARLLSLPVSPMMQPAVAEQIAEIVLETVDSHAPIC